MSVKKVKAAKVVVPKEEKANKGSVKPEEVAVDKVVVEVVAEAPEKQESEAPAKTVVKKKVTETKAASEIASKASTSSADFVVGEAVKKIRQLETMEELLLFTKGETRVGVKNAIIVAKRRLTDK